jgi:acyl carrier protein
MIDDIRQLIAEHGRMPISAQTLDDTQDLYASGLTSFAAVQLMLALEDRFEVEFPESMLNRRSFASIAAIKGCIEELMPKSAAA